MVEYLFYSLFVVLSNWIVFGAIHHRQHGTFPTTTLRHVEPLKALNIQHEDIGNPQELRIKNGLHQLYPDQIELQFEAFGKKHSFRNLQIMDKIFAPHSKFTIDHGDGLVVSRPNKLNAYSQDHFLRDNGALVVMHGDGNFTAMFFHENELHYAEPLISHSSDMEDRVASVLSQHAVHNMIVFKSSDVIVDADNPPACGIQSTDGSQMHSYPMQHSRDLLELPKWDCANDGVIRQLKVGWVADYGFVQSYPSTALAEAAITQIIASSNVIYTEQVMVALEASEVYIKATSEQGSYESWNQKDSCFGISDKLKVFAEWRAKVKPEQFGLWHLLSDCYNSGTVGLASIAVLCMSELTSGGQVSSSSTGVSGKTRETWQTVAHELGHNFNMQHSFDYDSNGNKIHYGGIMDYGDGFYDGQIQFNTPLRKTETCEEVNAALNDKKANNRYSNVKFVEVAQCIGTYDPFCGNGVAEAPSEVCDDGADNGNSQSCCSSSCTLKSSAQCGEVSECCVSCMWEPTSTTCNGGVGYCLNGVCTDGICNNFGWTQGCSGEELECEQKCTNGGSCMDLDRWTSGGQPISAMAKVADGAFCKSGGTTGQCSNALCQVAATTYSWSVGVWSTCSLTCGDGTQSRTVSCIVNGVSTSDADCVNDGIGSKPITSQSCNSGSCYSWDSGSYGACSQFCRYEGEAKPKKTRSVFCLRDASVVVSDGNCDPNTKLSTESNCNGAACIGSWVQGGFGSCSTQCGDGIQTQTVVCKEARPDLVTVSDTVCTEQGIGSKPDTTQICNLAECVTYGWQIDGDYGSCTPATCGETGTQTRVVNCIDTTSKVIQSDLQCSNTKPASERACDNELCPDYQWNLISDWTPTCPTACGSPSQTQGRIYQCVNVAPSPNVVVLDLECSATKPVTTKECPLTGPCPVFEWRNSQWGDCMKSGVFATCTVNGQRTRTAACYDVAPTPDQLVSDSSCAGTIDLTEACIGACTVADYKWISPPWDLLSCSKTCEQGIMTRTLTCEGPNGLALESKCGGTKPASEASCNAFACPKWVTGKWEICDAVCGEGIQSRSVLCKNHFGDTVDQSECLSSKPGNEQACKKSDCPSWHAGSWSPCNKVCGTTFPGKQYRSLTCRMPLDNTYKGLKVNEALCPAMTVAERGNATEQTCNEFICSSYYWDADASGWSSCSLSCGNGVETATMVCRSKDVGNVVVDNTQCTSSQPSGSRSCNTQSCPTAQWHSLNWGACSAECEGVQTREVNCINEVTNAQGEHISDVIDSNNCQGQVPSIEESCNVGSVCGQGKCIQGVCNCAVGKDGPLCDQTMKIKNVVLSGSLSSVPAGQPLTVTWETEGSVDHVSLLLTGVSLEYPMYIAKRIPNSLLHSFTTPFDLSQGTYKVMVYYSGFNYVYAESNAFVANDPCENINCHHGTCNSNSAQCSCSSYFGGPLCMENLQYGLRSDDCDSAHVCACASGYQGDDCTTPDGCSILACANGAIPEIVLQGCPSKCVAPGSTICPIGFEGSLCSSCAKICSHGEIDPLTCSCQCPSGYFSELCDCEYGMVTVSMAGAPVSQSTSWKKLIENDFAITLGLDSKWVGMQQTDGTSNDITVLLYDQTCSSSFWYGGAHFGEQIPSWGADNQVLGTGVMSSISTIKAELSSELSTLRRGYLTSFLDPNIFSYVANPSYIDPCLTRTCSGNGICNINSGTCDCFERFLGDNCGIVDLCYDNTCNGRGTCALGVCTCDSGWSGSTCLSPPDGCDGRLCSQGTCTNSMCVCNGGWAGIECNILLDACFQKDCGDPFNGACFGGMCTCTDGWAGVDCRLPVELCPIGKCNNHGNCLQGVCTCVGGYSGSTCLQAPPTCIDGQKNQGEEKTDCGGPCTPCPSCTNGIQDSSEGGIDCGGPCITQCATCGDGLKNGDETGVDCGGSCAACGVTSSCTDLTKNGQETGIDCGGPCPVCPVYKWLASNSWSECTAECGEGIQQRDRFCKDQSTNSTVDDLFCSSLHPVSKTQSCNEQACSTYKWVDSGWGDCSTPCGSGVQIRQLTCLKDISENVPVAFCDLHAANKPSGTEACNTQACTSGSHVWRLDPQWGDCSVACGSGKQKRTVYCSDDQQRITDDSLCDLSVKPNAEQTCNTQACLQYQWETCSWSECTAECGGGANGGSVGGTMLGERTRKIMCMRNGVLSDASYCNATQRLLLSDSDVGCNYIPCTDYNWMTTKWTSCIVSDLLTGKGIRRRSYHCHSPDGGNAAISDCEKHVGFKRPHNQEDCWADKCPDYIPVTAGAIPTIAESMVVIWGATLIALVLN